MQVFTHKYLLQHHYDCLFFDNHQYSYNVSKDVAEIFEGQKGTKI